MPEPAEPSTLEMVVRRGIVILAVLLTLSIVWLVHGRMSASEASRDASFFENASAIQGAFRKALGPHPPVLEVVIEPEQCTAQVVVGSTATQLFTLGTASGYVVAGSKSDFPERDDTAFSMSTVPFPEVPELVAKGARTLEGEPARLVVDRLPGAKQLRFRVFAHDGRVAEVVRTQDPPPPSAR